MSRIGDLFGRKQSCILNVYCTAGFPAFNSTLTVMKELEKNGVDLVEIGMPYSDPLADGPIIQASGAKALLNGMSIPELFQQLKEFRKEISIPVVLMGYLNPVLQYGFEKFCSDAAMSGIDGLIIPDLPMYEFEREYGLIINNYGLDFIFLVTPETSEERIRKLDQLSSGFLYAVSSSSLTGTEKNFGQVELFLKRLQSLNLTNPVLVGFGIRDRKSFQSACAYSSGAIIGSAYIKALEEGNRSIGENTKRFIDSIIT